MGDILIKFVQQHGAVSQIARGSTFKHSAWVFCMVVFVCEIHSQVSVDITWYTRYRFCSVVK